MDKMGNNKTTVMGLWLLLLSWLLTGAVHAEPVCTEVKIEIKQELTLERQAFDANMKITNDLDSIPLQDVTINVNFKDEDDNPVLATSDPNATGAKFLSASIP
ncbi:MAG TPA: hypothetical protein EYH06_01405 [Chromatiales bacterium]|nr:hypothetical protein [Thiotrichales bacterium]HIP67231.1 hypothetical protein [Chromatiales bacterium]